MTYAPVTVFNENDGLSVDRANQIYTALSRLITPPYKIYTKPTGEANLTTTSTTFGTVDNTVDKFNLTIVTFGNPVEIGFNGLVNHSVSGGLITFDVEMDGALLGGASNNWDAIFCASNAGSYRTTWRRIHTVAAGSHTFKLMWKITTAGTGTLYSNSLPQFYVREI